MDEIIVHIDAGQTIRFFEYAGYRARRMREPLARSGGLLLSWINLTFTSEGRNLVEPWRPLSPKWRKYKETHRPGAGILEYDRILLRAAISRTALTITNDTLIYELEEPPYADVHQYGATATSKNGKPIVIPARPFVNVTPELEDTFTEVFREWIDDIHSIASRGRPRKFADVPHPFD